MKNLDGKTVLITHADRAAGAAVARACAEAGARTLLHFEAHSADGPALAEAIGVRQSDTINADLHIPEHPTALWNAAMDRTNRIDALVNIAGLYRPSYLGGGDLAWLESWRRSIQANLTAPADLCRAAVPHFRANQGGVIVNISWPDPEETGGALDVGCAAARGGLVSMSRTLARAFFDKNIAVHMLAPAEGDASLPMDSRAGLYECVSGTPCPSVRTVEECGALAASLCAEPQMGAVEPLDRPWSGKQAAAGRMAALS